MTSARTRARMVERLQQQGIQDKGVLGAINKVERHLFVDEAFAHRAYEDTALPLGQGQTISQPYIVARMIECLRADPFSFFCKDPVAAVDASSHDEVSCHHVFSVLRAPDEDPSARIRRRF